MRLFRLRKKTGQAFAAYRRKETADKPMKSLYAGWIVLGGMVGLLLSGVLVVDDFEAYQPGGRPSKWKYLKGRKLVPLEEAPTYRVPFWVQKEGNNQFLRVRVKDGYARIVQANGDTFEWNLDTHPYLSWRWRALQLPPGAREDRKKQNDTGAALYVTFSFNFLGIPRSIKYTYSSTLPVGTVVSYGNLKVLVVSSGKERIGSWKTIVRNVREDYRTLFGKYPPDRPVSIALWSDSNDTDSIAEADFDDIRLLPATEEHHGEDL